MKTLKDYYAEHAGKGSDKWDLYLSSYDQVLVELRHKPISLLEIGVQNGGSLEIWAKYFPRARRFVGCDIDKRCERLSYDDDRISLVIGDINNSETLERVLNVSGEFDLIIDDGSHASTDIIKSFSNLFKRLKDDGIYIVEDLHCSYWAHYEGGLFYPESSMSFFKTLVDVINHQHWGNGYSRTKILEVFNSIGGNAISEEDLSAIHSIEFFNSICVVKKKSANNNVLGTRLIAGEVFNVCEPARINSFSRIVQASEVANKWAHIQKSAEEHEEEKNLLSNERDVLSKEKEQLSKEKEQLSEEKERLLKEKKQLSDERNRLCDLVEALRSSKRALEGEVKLLGSALTEKSLHLEQITATISWRVTKPLRALRRGMRRMVGF